MVGRSPTAIHRETNQLLEEAFAVEASAKALLGPAGQAVMASGRRGEKRGRRKSFLDMHTLVEAAGRAEEDAGNRKVATAVRKKMVEAAHLRWRVVLRWEKIAVRESKNYPDLLQEARIGLFEAAKRFDPSKGILFSTYSRWWARAYVTRAHDRDTSGRLSSVRQERLRILRHWERLGYRGVALIEKTGLTEDEFRDLRLAEAFHDPRSLDSLMGKDDDGGGGVGFQPAANLSPWEAIEAKLDLETVLGAVSRLPPRLRKILQMRFRIAPDDSMGDEPMTLTEVGKVLRLSRERIRQLEQAALKALRAEVLEGSRPEPVEPIAQIEAPTPVERTARAEAPIAQNVTAQNVYEIAMKAWRAGEKDPFSVALKAYCEAFGVRKAG